LSRWPCVFDRLRGPLPRKLPGKMCTRFVNTTRPPIPRYRAAPETMIFTNVTRRHLVPMSSALVPYNMLLRFSSPVRLISFKKITTPPNLHHNYRYNFYHQPEQHAHIVSSRHKLFNFDVVVKCMTFQILFSLYYR